MKTFGTICLAIMIFFGVLIGLKACNWTNQAVNVISHEASPQEMLRKYTWFKDAAAVLDKKRADIQLYEQRLAAFEAQWGNKEMPRHAVEQQTLWMTEMLGVKSSYNSLAAEYNAAMAKINWAFCNVGDLPAGAIEPLPREFITYLSK